MKRFGVEEDDESMRRIDERIKVRHQSFSPGPTGATQHNNSTVLSEPENQTNAIVLYTIRCL
jgi:hypothetical protein